MMFVDKEKIREEKKDTDTTKGKEVLGREMPFLAVATCNDQIFYLIYFEDVRKRKNVTKVCDISFLVLFGFFFLLRIKGT